MLRFKRLDYAAVTITGIELVHQIKKEQFDVSALCSSQARTSHVWEAVLAASAIRPYEPSLVFNLRIAPQLVCLPGL